MPKLLTILIKTQNFFNLIDLSPSLIPFAFSINSPLKYVIIVVVPIKIAYLGFQLI
ncbi:hypothetical protein SDC9_168257 [bioreactor metagenome]|uniref:Uncharacterized protein n=1 Tax=bioreactor metagenome TaxID=1076179 RepID=A0A645G209_9ZZZZ